MSISRRQSMINSFQYMVNDQGLCRTAALDIVVAENSDLNEPAIRTIFKSPAGWHY